MENNTDCQRLEMLLTPTALVNYEVLQYSYAILAFVTIILNLLVMLAFYKLRYYKTRHHKFLITLTFTDLLASLSVEPLISYDFSLMTSQIHNAAPKSQKLLEINFLLFWRPVLAQDLIFLKI